MANKNNHVGTNHITNDTTSKFEPMRRNNFEVQITGLNKVNAAGTSNPMTTKSKSDGYSLLTLSVASYSAPQVNINPITVHYGNNSAKFAGKPEFPDSSLVVNDYVGADVEGLIMSWQNAVYNTETEQIGVAAYYKKTGYLLEYDMQGCLIRSWTIHGCWPSQVNLGDFSQEDPNIRQITITLTYDKITLNKGGSGWSVSDNITSSTHSGATSPIDPITNNAALNSYRDQT